MLSAIAVRQSGGVSAADDPRPTELLRTREFFGARAGTWDERFPDDAPRYERAVGELSPPPAGRVLDAGCGTGRALPFLRAAVGPAGVVLGVDVTSEMVREAARRARDAAALLVQADVLALPLPDGSVDAVLAAGLISHLPEPGSGLAELARVCRTGGRLALFHPVGRAALARRHGRELTPEDVRAEPNVRALLARTGWHCTDVDDGDERYLVLATRAEGAGPAVF
jgi:SAM-dependent methyltransferase